MYDHTGFSERVVGGMATGTYNIEHNQGDTFHFYVTWRDSEGDPVDLSGRTARMQLRTSVDADDVTIELTTENGRIALGGTSGVVELIIDAEDTAEITPASYKYDLEIITGNDVRKILKGKFKIIAEVTR